MQRIAHRRHHCLHRGHHDVYWRQDRYPSATTGGTRDQNRSGLRNDRFAGSNAGVTGLKLPLIKARFVDCIAVTAGSRHPVSHQ